MDLRNSLTLLALLFGAVASGFVLMRSDPDQAKVDSAPRLGIGYYMNEAELFGTGDDGRVLYRVSARTASQSFDDGVIDMEEVRVIYDPLADIPWQLTAVSGRIPVDSNIIQLTGDVVAETMDDGEDPTTIRTDYLELDAETFIASTQHKVAIDKSGNRVFATGMRAYLKEDRLELVSNVNGKFHR